MTRRRVSARQRLEEPADLGAYEVRFKVFLQHAKESSIAIAAFDAFEVAIETVCEFAAMSPEVGPDFDDNEEYHRELESLRPSVGAMMFNGLEHIDVAYMIQYADGFGLALRYGLIEVHPDALDDVLTEEYVELAERGRQLSDDEMERAMRAAVEMLETTKSSGPRKKSRAKRPVDAEAKSSRRRQKLRKKR